jgi:hypothetical protein
MFLAVSGSGEIRYKGKAALIPFRCLRASGAIPPGYKLEVCNLSAAEPFSVLLIGGPSWQGYEHVRTQAPPGDRMGPATSEFGTKPTCRSSHCMSVIGREAEVGLRVRQFSF